MLGRLSRGNALVMPPFDSSKVQAHSGFTTEFGTHGHEEQSEGGQMEVDSIVAPKLHPIGLEVTFGTKNIFDIANLSNTMVDLKLFKTLSFKSQCAS